MFGGGPKVPKSAKGPGVDPGPAPGDPTNTAAQGAIGEVAAAEGRRLAKKGLASTYINGAAGIPNQSATAPTLSAVRPAPAPAPSAPSAPSARSLMKMTPSARKNYG